MFDSLFPSHWSTLRKLMWLKLKGASAVWETITGNPVSFTALSAPLRKLSIAFSPVQDLHGYDSPWPAGGGKNKCPTPIEDNVVYRNGGYLFTITFNNGVMTWEITGTASTYFMLKAFTITQDHVGKTYTMSFSSTPEIDMASTASCLRLWDSATQTRTNLNSRTVTITADMVGQDLCLAFYKSGTGTFVISNCQLEEGSSATSYAPYSNECPISGWSSLTVYHSGADTSDPQTISISIGSTYYSGWVDAVTGIGEVTHRSVDLGSFNWTYRGANTLGMFSTPLSEYEKPSSWSVTPDAYCSAYKVDSLGVMLTRTSDLCVSLGRPNLWDGFLLVKDKAYTDAADFKTAVTGVQLVYELATPIPIQLTPQEINSLAGDNTIWSNANRPITVEYRKN